jgi:hypothetical protein
MKSRPDDRRIVNVLETGRMLREEAKAVCASMRRTCERARANHAGFREWQGSRI